MIPSVRCKEFFRIRVESVTFSPFSRSHERVCATTGDLEAGDVDLPVRCKQ